MTVTDSHTTTAWAQLRLGWKPSTLCQFRYFNMTRKGNTSEKKAKQQLLTSCKLTPSCTRCLWTWWPGILENAFLLSPATISKLEALTPADFTNSSENLAFLLDSAAIIWNKKSMTVSSKSTFPVLYYLLSFVLMVSIYSLKSFFSCLMMLQLCKIKTQNYLKDIKCSKIFIAVSTKKVHPTGRSDKW